MPYKQYYHIKTISSKQTQFFNTSKAAESPDGELTTNMPKESELLKNFDVDRLMVELPFEETQASAASTSLMLDDQKTFVDEGVITVQVGDNPEYYLLVSEALKPMSITATAELSQATAADDQYQLASLVRPSEKRGIELPITIPAGKNFTVKWATETAPSGTKVKLIFAGTE